MNFFNIFWGGVLLLLPLWIRIEIVPMDMRFAKDMFFVACILMSIPFFQIKKDIDYRIKAIVVYLLFISAFNQWYLISFAVILQWFYFSLGIICFLQFYSNLKNKDFDFYLNIFSVASILQSSWIIFNYLGIKIYPLILKILLFDNFKSSFKEEGAQIIGSLGNPMVGSTFLAITGMSLLRKKWGCLIPLVFVALYFTESATGMLAFLVGLFVFVFFKILKKRKIFYPVIAIIISLAGTAFFYFKNDLSFLNDSGRFKVWSEAITLVKGPHIIFGNGLGYIRDNFSFYFQHTEKFVQLHNEFLEIYAAFGIIGIAILFFILFAMLKNTKNAILISMVFTYLTVMTTAFPLHISATAILGIVITAFCLIEGENKNGLNNCN